MVGIGEPSAAVRAAPAPQNAVGSCSRRAEWPAGNGDVTALMGSCSSFLASQLISVAAKVTTPVSGRVLQAANQALKPGCAGPGPLTAHSPGGLVGQPHCAGPSEWGDHQGGHGGSCNCGSCAPTPPVSGRIKGRRRSWCNCRWPCVSRAAQWVMTPVPTRHSGSEADKGQSRSRSVAVCAWDRNQPKVTPRHAISTRASQRPVPVCRDTHRQHESRVWEAQAGG